MAGRIVPGQACPLPRGPAMLAAWGGVRITDHVGFIDSGATIKATSGSVEVTPYSAALR